MLLGKKWNDSKKQKLNNMVSISFSTSHPKNIIDIYKIPFERTTSHTYIYKCLKNEFNLFFSYEEYTIDFFFFFNCSLHKGIHVSQSVIFVQKKHRTKLSFNKKKINFVTRGVFTWEFVYEWPIFFLFRSTF